MNKTEKPSPGFITPSLSPWLSEIKESIRTAGELGNKNEQLLKIAIDHIFGNVQFISSDDNIKQIDIPEESFKQQLIKDRVIIK